MVALSTSVIEAFEYVHERTVDRIRGMGDEEYFWEPVEGCWSLRQNECGRWLLDGEGGGGPTPDPVPVTTVAWRLGHIGGTVGGFARMRFGDGRRLTSEDLDVPRSATEVGPFLDGHMETWLSGLRGLDEADWSEPLGESFGAYARSTTLDLAMHVFDEVVHHAAEVGVLRDLWGAGFASRVVPGR